MSTTVMSLASETRLSATLVPTWPAPRMMIFNFAPQKSVSGELGFATRSRKIHIGWSAFYAFLLRRKTEGYSSFLPAVIPNALSLRYR